MRSDLLTHKMIGLPDFLSMTAISRSSATSPACTSEDEYVWTVCDFLEYLPPQTTIHRLAGNGLRTELVAPRWIGKKLDTLNRIDREFMRRNSSQGSRFILY